MNTKPNPFIDLVACLEDTYLSGKETTFQDPNLSSRLDSYAILQQCTLTHHLQTLLAPDPDRPAPTRGGTPTPTFVAGTYLKILNLIERSKSRVDRIAGRLQRQPSAHESFQLNAAVQFLITELSGGERPAREIIKLAKSLSISERTLNRAKAEIGILSIQRATPNQTPTETTPAKSRTWFWALPSELGTPHSELRTGIPQSTSSSDCHIAMAT